MAKEKSLKKRIEATLYQRNGFRYQHPDWDRKLWSKKKDQIKEYLLERFNTTMDVVEYYSCACLLYHLIPAKQVLVEFRDSPQYKRYWNQTEEKTIQEIPIPKTSTKTPKSLKIKQVKVLNGIRIIGE